MDQHKFEQRFRQIVSRLNEWNDRGAPAPVPFPAPVRTTESPREQRVASRTDETRPAR